MKRHKPKTIPKYRIQRRSKEEKKKQTQNKPTEREDLHILWNDNDKRGHREFKYTREGR